MSQRRVCDVDGTAIDPLTDEFFTVTSGRDGRAKDICVYCARAWSEGAVSTWVASTALDVGDRVHPTTGFDLGKTFDVVTAGVTGETEPVWPDLVGTTITDGTVTFVVHRSPIQAAFIYEQLPGQPPRSTSVFGWIYENYEPV
jgi:hypothetical protein